MWTEASPDGAEWQGPFDLLTEAGLPLLTEAGTALTIERNGATSWTGGSAPATAWS